MAQGRTSKNHAGKSAPSIVTIIAVVLFVLIFGFDYFKEDASIFTNGSSSNPTVHFIDVGQGSSTLLQSGSKGILIDVGESEYAPKVISYIKSCGVKELEYVVASHPHTDHIGGMSEVLNEISAENIIMPQLSQINTPTTRTYENLLKTVKSKGIKAIAAKYGSIYTLDNIKLEILGPNEQVKDLNNMSVICKATAYSTSFMILADAEKQEMQTVTNKGASLRSTFIIMGHHGSRTSLDNYYLNCVNAKVAIISCGKNNSYGHPHEETLKYLNSKEIEFYRTDEVGSIVVNCYENGYSIKTEKR